MSQKTKIRKPRQPKEIELETRRGKVLFTTFDYGTNKGKDARIYVKLQGEAGHGMQWEEHEGVKFTYQVQEWFYGLDADSMRRLAKWANKAAKYLDAKEPEY